MCVKPKYVVGVVSIVHCVGCGEHNGRRQGTYTQISGGPDNKSRSHGFTQRVSWYYR